MKTTLLALLFGFSAAASALPGVNLSAPAASDDSEITVIRINTETGVAEIKEGPTWVPMETVQVDEAKVEKAYYEGNVYGRPYGGYYGGYNDGCGQVACEPVLPPPCDPCAGQNRVYVAPYGGYGYQVPPPIYRQAPPVYAPQYYYPNRVYRRGPSIYYNYPRGRVYRRY